MKENIIVIGGGTQAMTVIDIIEPENKYNIAGVTDTVKKVGDRVLNYPVLGTQEDIPAIMKKYNVIGGIVALGDNYVRANMVEYIKKIAPTFRFISTIHPTAWVGNNASVGEGSVIMVGSIISVNSKVGNHCLVCTNSSLEHGGVMEDYSSLSSGVTTGGYVKLGKYSAITLGVTIIDRITIGENVVVGSGSLVMNDIGDNVLAYGLPAKEIRKREPGERFLK